MLAQGRQAAVGGTHIAMIVNSYPPRIGGLETHVADLAAELVKLGTCVTVISLAPEASDTVEDGIRVLRLPMHFRIASVISFPAWGTGRRLRAVLRDEGVDVVSTHTRFFPMSYVGLRAAQRSGIPVIHTEHGAGFVMTPSRFIRIASRMVDLTMGRLVLKGATRVLAVSGPGAAFVRRLAGADVDVDVFHNALRLEDWPRAEGNHAPTGIAYLGRLVGGKGWELFIDVAAELIHRRGFDDLVVHVLGDGPDYGALCERVEASGIAGSVRVHGHSGVETIRAALHNSVLVNPSRLAEGFQITLLEGAAAGAQIVSFPVPSVGPLRRDGGPVREVADMSFAALVDSVDDALRNPMPPMSRDVLEARWSWTVRAREYRELMETVIGHPDATRVRGLDRA